MLSLAKIVFSGKAIASSDKMDKMSQERDAGAKKWKIFFKGSVSAFECGTTVPEWGQSAAKVWMVFCDEGTQDWGESQQSKPQEEQLDLTL